MNISEKIKDKLLEDSTIDEDERELIEYGIFQGLFLVVNLVTFFMISIIFDVLWQGICFLLIFWPLRIYAGGYHAESSKSCYILSSISEILILGGIRYIYIEKNILLYLTILSVAIILWLSPQDNSNKKLEESEVEIYRKKIIRVLCLNMILFCIAYLMKLYLAKKIIFFSLGFMVILLIVGCIKSKIAPLIFL